MTRNLIKLISIIKFYLIWIHNSLHFTLVISLFLIVSRNQIKTNIVFTQLQINECRNRCFKENHKLTGYVINIPSLGYALKCPMEPSDFDASRFSSVPLSVIERFPITFVPSGIGRNLRTELPLRMPLYIYRDEQARTTGRNRRVTVVFV